MIVAEKHTGPEVVVTCAVEDSDVPLATQDTPAQEDYLVRRLSNLEESELKFRGHRDSVTLERNQVLRSNSAPPELLTHGKTTAKARRRMHARIHVGHGSHSASPPKLISLESF